MRDTVSCAERLRRAQEDAYPDTGHDDADALMDAEPLSRGPGHLEYTCGGWAYMTVASPAYSDTERAEGRKIEHYALNPVNDQIFAIDFSPHRKITEADFRRLDDLGFPRRVGIGPLDEADILRLYIQRAARDVRLAEDYTRGLIEVEVLQRAILDFAFNDHDDGESYLHARAKAEGARAGIVAFAEEVSQ